MKNIFLMSVLALCSFAANAQWTPPPGNPMPPFPTPFPSPVYPQVLNLGSRVEVLISNRNSSYVWCTGTLSMYTDERTYIASVSINVYPRGYVTRSYFPNSSSRINRVTHNIYCR